MRLETKESQADIITIYIGSPVVQFPPVHPLTQEHPLIVSHCPPFIHMQTMEQLNPNLLTGQSIKIRYNHTQHAVIDKKFW